MISDARSAPGSEPRRALLISTYSASSPFKLGTHHICDGLVERGWQTTLVTHPLAPLTLFGHTSEKRLRWRNLMRVAEARDGPFKEYSRLQWYVPVNRHWAWPGLAETAMAGVGWPSVARIVRDRGLADGVDLLYMDNVWQPFWLNRLAYRKFVLRLPDNPLGFGPLQAPLLRLLRHTVAAADLVVCPSERTEAVAAELGASRTLRLGNGVDVKFFADAAARPPEYATSGGPIGIYLGAWDRRVDTDLLRETAARLPSFRFFVIGEVRVSASRLPENLTLLGPVPYERLPGYLQHADVGLLPFDVTGQPELVESVDPLKLYQYLAAGLPVVSTDIPASARAPGAVLIVGQRPADFAGAVEEAVAWRPPRDPALDEYDWRRQVARLLRGLEFTP